MFGIDLTWYELILFALAGTASGIINTLAGSGSLLTLPIFIFICGLPASLANATNRVGVMLQSMVGLYGFQQKGAMNWTATGWLLMPAVVGGILGSSIAVGLSERTMNYIIGGLMVFMLIVLLLKPERWIHESAPDPNRHRHPATVFTFFLIGIYGGFIQAGVGIFILASLVLVSKFTLRAGNGIKVLLVAAFTLPSLLVFAYYGQVQWGYGVLMAVFQGLGAWLGVHYAAKMPNANLWIYRLLVLVVAVSALKFFW